MKLKQWREIFEIDFIMTKLAKMLYTREYGYYEGETKNVIFSVVVGQKKARNMSNILVECL